MVQPQKESEMIMRIADEKVSACVLLTVSQTKSRGFFLRFESSKVYNPMKIKFDSIGKTSGSTQERNH